MKSFISPLDNIRVASPCPADWNQMFGNDRKRFCGQCKLNIYNLSDMTRAQAEDLLLSSEGRLCVRYYRRADGTILTKNCPVGWQAVTRRVSNLVTAAFSIVAGLTAGILGFELLESGSKVTDVSQPVAMTDKPPKPPFCDINRSSGQFVTGERAIMGNVALPVKVRGK